MTAIEVKRTAATTTAIIIRVLDWLAVGSAAE
jgi:hypothetical protein